MTFQRPGNAAAFRQGPLADPLTTREHVVLELIAIGLSNRDIAARLFVATSTVKSYINSIFRRLAWQVGPKRSQKPVRGNSSRTDSHQRVN